MQQPHALLLAAGVREQTITRLVESLGSITQVAMASAAELRAAGVPPKTADKLSAAFAFARASVAGDTMRETIGRPDDIWYLLRGRIASLSQECFYVIAVDVRNQLLDVVEVARGHVCGVEVHPREVFRPAIRLAAAGIMIAHNHPSGDPTPSPEDIALTRRLMEVGKTLGIPVLDHVVVATTSYRSIAEWMGADL